MTSSDQLAGYLWETFEPHAKLDVYLPLKLESRKRDWWVSMSILAEVGPPSSETIRQVIQRIRTLGRDARDAEMRARPRLCRGCLAVLECEPWPAPAPLLCEACEAVTAEAVN
jgi:hypothetical protein